MLPEHLREVPKLSKPYVIENIRDILDSLIGQVDTRQASSQIASE
jgi:hypothetical protein